MKYQAIDSDYIKEMKEYDEFMRDKKLLYKGMKYGYFVAIFIIIISAFFNGNLVLAQPIDLNFDFERNALYSVENPLITNSTNLSYAGNYTGHYNATFSFENDTGDPDGWNVIETAGAVDIIDSENGHSKVLKIEDTDGSEGITISKTMLDATQHGTIEFWWLFNDTSKIDYYQVSLEGIKIFYFGVFADKFQYSDSSGWHDVGLGALNNTWYRISVNYESSNSGYKGLSQYQWNVYIDGVEYGDFSFWTNVDTITYIQEYFFTYTFDFDYYMLVDAIGYSWDDDYEIGDNIVAHKTTLDTTHIDKWEFTHTEGGVYDEDQATVPFWSEMDGDETTENGYVKLFSEDSDNKGIYKDDFAIQDGILNITLNFEYEVINVHDTVQYFQIFSYDTTEIVRLRIHTIGYDASSIHYLSYYDGASYNNISYVYEDVPDEFNLYIDNMITLRNNSEIIEQFPLIDNSKKGLSQVKFYGNCPNGDSVGQNWYSQFHIESIGVYSNGTSLSNDYSSFSLFVNETWDSNEQHLFKTDIVGNCSIVALGFPSLSSPHTLYSSHNYIGEQILNVWNEFTGGNEAEGWLSLPNCYLYFSGNESLTINSISIEGVMLTQDSNEYIPVFTSGNINLQESYFYVSGSRLYYSLITDGTNLEFIQFDIDIINEECRTRAISFSHEKSNANLYSEMRITYVGSTYTYYSSITTITGVNSILSQDKVIDSFRFTISDNDNDYNGTNTGYFTSLTLIYYPDIETTLTTLSLIEVIPLLILFTLIPVVIYYGFGRRKELVVPSIALISIFATGVGMFPIWAEVIVIFSLIVYYAIKSKGGA